MNLPNLPQAVRLVIEAMQNKKASAITVLDLSKIGTFTEYFIVCTGFSTPQVQAICTEVEQQLYKELKREPEHREGRRSNDWALLDFGGFVEIVAHSLGGHIALRYAGVYPETVTTLVAIEGLGPRWVTDEAKGTSVTVQSNASGDFTVEHLIPDIYDVKVDASGFKGYQQKGIQVFADNSVKVAPALTAGGSEVTVEVNADAVPQPLIVNRHPTQVE